MKIAVSYRDISETYFENQPLNKLPKIQRLMHLRRVWAHRKQFHAPGFFYFSSLKKHVYYESYLESQILLHLDFTGDIKALVEQPFLLSHANQQHIPDFICEHKNGEITLVNVKPAEFINKPDNVADFALADAAALEAGWQHRVLTQLNSYYIDNLQWLSAYRDEPYQLDVLTEQILSSLNQPKSLADVIQSVGNPYLVKPVVFHLLWYQRLFTQLEAQFSLQMPLWVGQS